MAIVPSSSHGTDLSSANTWTANQTAPAWIASGLTGATAASRYVGATASGAPASGTFSIGDFIIDQSGKIYVCTSAGSPGTWTQVAGGAMTLLSTTTAASIDVSGISQAYNDLVIQCILRDTTASTTTNLTMLINNDSAAHYGHQYVLGNTAAVSAVEGNSQSAARLGTVPAANAAAGLYGFIDILIPGYTSTTWQKAIISTYVYATDITTGARSIYHEFQFWNQTSAITRLTIQNTLTSASTMRIYGRL